VGFWRMRWGWARRCRRARCWLRCSTADEQVQHTPTTLHYSYEPLTFQTKPASGPTLIACPATLTWQWVRELAKWVPPLKCVVVQPSSTARDIEKLYKLCRTGAACVVVVTYEQIRRRCAELSFPTWSIVFLDEGHRIRNPDAEVAPLPPPNP